MIKARFSLALNRVFILAGEGGLIFSHCSFLSVNGVWLTKAVPPRYLTPTR